MLINELKFSWYSISGIDINNVWWATAYSLFRGSDRGQQCAMYLTIWGPPAAVGARESQVATRISHAPLPLHSAGPCVEVCVCVRETILASYFTLVTSLAAKRRARTRVMPCDVRAKLIRIYYVRDWQLPGERVV